jgi:hypothetical protein
VGLILYILSLIVTLLFAPIGFVYSCVLSFKHLGFKEGLKAIDRKLLKMAVGVDIMGGVVCAEWFNRALIRQDAPLKFGQKWITISEILGVNQRTRNLTLTGKRLKNLLGVIEPGHTRKAAKDN